MWRLFFFSVLVLLLSYLWTRLNIRGITGQVERPSERYHVGEYFSQEITLFNKSRIPKLLIRVRENTDLPGYHNMVAFNLPPKGSHCWQTNVYCQRRGRYSLGNLTATGSDPFGFFSLSRTLGEPQSILVYPAISELPFFQPLSRNEYGYGSSSWLINEPSPNAARVREYTSGDTLNRIHWHSTAHTGRLMVKEFDSDRSYHAFKNIWIIPDMYQASQLGDGNETTEEYCISIAASLVNKYIDSGKQVGLIASGDRSYLFPPQQGSQYLWQILEALAVMKATGDMPIDQLISREMERLGSDSSTIVITPSISERMVASLRQMRTRGIMVIVILLDTVSFGGTVSVANIAKSFISSGIQVYVVSRGESLMRALNSQALTPYMR